MTTKTKAADALAPAPDPVGMPTGCLAYSVDEAAQTLGVHSFSVYRMIQRGELRASRLSRGKILIPRAELLKLLKSE